MKRKTTKTTAKKVRLSNTQLCEAAKRKSGVIDARIISPSQVETAAWVRLKCQFGCDGFGQCLVCPPFTPTPQQMREVLDVYRRAVLLHCEPEADVKAMVAELEREIFLSGCWKAFGLVQALVIFASSVLLKKSSVATLTAPARQWRPAESMSFQRLKRSASPSKSSEPPASAQITTA